MDQIPHDIALAVRAEGKAAKGYAGELPAVHRRAHRRRTRRRATAVAAALVVLAGGGFALRPRPEALQPAATPPAPAQRLVLAGVSGEFESSIRLAGDLQIGELSADDHLITHAVEGGGRYEQAVGLPDGRLVSLGPRGADPADGSGGSGQETLLTVQGPGRPTQQRDIRQQTDPVALVSATATTAYLWRPHGLYGYDLAGGLERLVISSAMLDLTEADPAAAVDAADVVGDRLVIAAKRRSCRPELLSINPPEGVRFLPVTSLDCARVIDLRLSPSTNRVAVTYTTPTGGVQVAVLRTDDGAILADRELAPATTSQIRLAWLNERTVRGVIVPPASAKPRELTLFRIAT